MALPVPESKFIYIAIEYCSNKKRSDKRVAASGLWVHQCWSTGCKTCRDRIEN